MAQSSVGDILPAVNGGILSSKQDSRCAAVVLISGVQPDIEVGE